MTEPNVLVGLAFSHVHKLIKNPIEDVRADCNAQWAPSERRAVRHPITGEVLGFATRTNPDRVARITDEEELLPWVGDERPHDLIDVEEIRPEVTDDEIMKVLREHAPELLRPVVKISEQGRNAILKKAVEDEDFRPPGVEVSRPAGTTNFYPENAKAIESLFTDGVIAFDGTVRKELPRVEQQ